MNRRECLQTLAGVVGSAGLPTNEADAAKPKRTPVVNVGEHAWVINDPRFPLRPKLANCESTPNHDYSMEFLLSQMKYYGVDKVVIVHACYYGNDNSYATHCVKSHPDKFAAVGLLIGHRLHHPTDPKNPERLERAMRQERLVGMRLSPIYGPNDGWLNNPACYAFWKKADELGAVFNVFLAPHQIGQLADMAERYSGVKIVVDHFAMMNISKPDSEGIIPLLTLARFPNVYLRAGLANLSKQDIPYRDVWPYLRRAYDRFGPRRLLYAHFHERLIFSDLVPFFTAEDKEWIMGKTALEVYRFSQAKP